MKTNQNKGFSYIEMLMVLAIMAIMIGLVTISIGLINRNTVSRTLEKVETLCNKTRINALTKGSKNGYLNLAEFSDGVYAYVGEMVDDDNINKIREKGDKICSKDYEIITNFVGLGSTADCQIHRIAFKQSTGGVIGGLNGRVIVKKKNTTKTESFGIYRETGKVLS